MSTGNTTPKNFEIEKEVVIMVTVATTAIICVAVVMTVAIVCRPRHF